MHIRNVERDEKERERKRESLDEEDGWAELGESFSLSLLYVSLSTK